MLFKQILNFKNNLYVRQFINYRKLTLDSIQIKNETKPNIYEYLKMRIKATGPITVADYMRIVLTNADSGYYCAKKSIIGPDGDFTTSPEICQLFSEMVGVWMIHEWHKIGTCKPLQIVELGPGNGTLIADVIKVFKDLKMLQDIQIELVEINPHLAKKQAISLDCDSIEEINSNNLNDPYMKGIYERNITVNWRQRLQDVPRAFSIVLANEFFDAFPIHKFQKTEDGWREILIDIDPESKEEKEKFRMVLSKYETPYSKIFIKPNELRDTLEISPEAGSLIENLTSRLEEDGGFALIVDYGHDGTKTDTFRAFRNHQLHDPLVEPGSADLTADVDFAFFRDLAKKKMLTYGPIPQREFLFNIGIKQRLEIIKKQSSAMNQNDMEESFKMITDEDKMGGSFHFFALFPEVLKEHLMKFPPAGFTPLE